MNLEAVIFQRKTNAALVCIFAVFASQRLPATGFEAGETYKPGEDVSTHPEWGDSVKGAAQITEELAGSGKQSLQIVSAPAEQSAVFKASTPSGVTFIDFQIRPTVDDSATPSYTINANEAVMGFLMESDGATVVTEKSALKEATDTKFSFPVDDRNFASDWIRVTIRENLKARTWDLFLNGQLTLIDQPLTAGESSKTATLKLYSTSFGDTFVDDVSISGENPLFVDSDKDGIPDAVEMANGTNAFYDDRGLDPNANGLSNIEDFQRDNSLTLPTSLQRSSSTRRLVYIDSKVGTDSETGEMSYKVSQRGPKRTLRGAAQVKGGDVVFILMPSDTPYVCPDYPAGNYPDVSYVLLGNATLVGE